MMAGVRRRAPALRHRATHMHNNRSGGRRRSLLGLGGWCARLVHLTFAFVASLAVLATGCAGGAGRDASSPDAELRFRWVVPDGFPAAISLHRALDDQATGETRAYVAGEVARLGEALRDGMLKGRFDESQRVVLKVDNPSNESLRFWVTPHLPQPHEGDDALMAQCLCTGAVYGIPAHGSWTRVLEFGTRRRGAVTPLTLTHVIVLGEVPK